MHVVLGLPPAWAMFRDDPDDDVKKRLSFVPAGGRKISSHAGNVVGVARGQLVLYPTNRLVPTSR